MPSEDQDPIAAELDSLQALLREHPEGLSRREIEERYSVTSGEKMHRRTLLRRLQRLIESGRVEKAGPANAPVYRVPFEQSIFAMIHLPYLQPFVDVNKRTSRLAANIPLIQANLAPLSFVDVPRDLYLQATLAVYETRQTALLRDLYLWAYERSCAQYRIIRDALIQPDPLRLRYREELQSAVRFIVLSLRPPDEESLQAWATDAEIPENERAEFVTLARTILIDLNEGSAGRYRISPEELSAWQQVLRAD